MAFFSSAAVLTAVALPGNALAGLLAAVAWGGGDFSGGMGVKAAHGSTSGALRFILLAHGVSLAVLLVVLTRIYGPAPSGAPLGWGLLAGVVAGLSITAFYMALARGTMGASAALSGVIAAAIPALVSAVVEGAPHAMVLAGFAVAAVSIWIIAASPAHAGAQDRVATWLALSGGFGFGVYFTALRFANPLGVLEPVVLARIGSVVTCAVLLLVVLLRDRRHRQAVGPVSRTLVGWAMGVALLDTAGNLLYTWSTRLGRLDVAAVLASLYPASTILLAAWRLQERPTRRQWIGICMALVAVVMISA